MNEMIIETYNKYLRREYRKDNTRNNYFRFAKDFLKWIKKNKGKTYKQLTPDDTKDYKSYCQETFKVNGNVSRLNSVNNFVDKFLQRDELRITVPKSVKANKLVLSNEEIKKYKDSAETPLEKLIVTYQIDAYLRPSEFYLLTISQHDIKNQILYLDDTKTGNNSVILTPNMVEAFNEYLPYRIIPKHKTDEDKLIIIDKGSHYGLAPIPDSDFIYRQTKKIAAKAGFTRSVYPYLIKPSAITDSFNNKVNPNIIQRQARHKKIETTLLYNQISDLMVKEHYKRIQTIDMEDLTPEIKAKVWLDKLLSNEIDIKTFKVGLDVLLPDKQRGDDIGYA
jgi:integrase